MPIGEHDPLGPGFARRLRAALNQVTPPTPHVMAARYRRLPNGLTWRAVRLAPALAGAIILAAVCATAFAATGSSDPVVWSQRVATSIQSVGHIPELSPKQEPAQTGTTTQTSPAPQRGGRAYASPSQSPRSDRKGEPSDRPEGTPHPEPSYSPRPSPSPEPSDDGYHHSPWPSQSPWPSPHPQPSPPFDY